MAGKLRITGGILRNRKILVPQMADAGLVRPVTDKVREAIFSSLRAQIKEAVLLDLFAGSGICGIEALSRGCASVDFVELSKENFLTIEENISNLELDGSCHAYCKDALEFLKKNLKKHYDIVFVDPPYILNLAKDFWDLLLGYLHIDSIVIHRVKSIKEFVLPENYKIIRQKSYGNTLVTFMMSIK